MLLRPELTLPSDCLPLPPPYISLVLLLSPYSCLPSSFLSRSSSFSLHPPSLSLIRLSPFSPPPHPRPPSPILSPSSLPLLRLSPSISLPYPFLTSLALLPPPLPSPPSPPPPPLPLSPSLLPLSLAPSSSYSCSPSSAISSRGRILDL